MIKISLIAVTIIIVAVLYFFGVLILPQLLSGNKDDSAMPVLATDEEVLELLEENRDKSGPEISRLAQDYYYEDKIKEAYHLYQLALDKNPNEPVDYIGMANCYLNIGNLPMAMAYVDKALPLTENYDSILDLHSIHRSIANVYGVAAGWLGYQDPQVAVDTINEVLRLTDEMDQEDPDHDDYYRATRIEMYIRLGYIYSESPKIGSLDKAMDSTEALLDVIGKPGYTYYNAALNRFRSHDVAMGKIYMDKFEDAIGLTPDLLRLKTYYYLVNGEKNKARFYLRLVNATAISADAKINGAFVNATYYEAFGDNEKAKKFYYVIADSNPVEVLSKYMIDAKERLGLNYDTYYKECDDLKDRQNRRSLELNGAAPMVH